MRWKLPKIDYKTTYHGTSEQFAKEIASGKIDVTAGGGELGQGFYLGTELHVAKAWAKQKFGSETVVEFVMSEDDFWNFDIEALDLLEATTIRLEIKSRGAQKSHIFNKDIVWSPIVGGPKVYCDQDKWESPKGGLHLNGSEIIRRIR